MPGLIAPRQTLAACGEGEVMQTKTKLKAGSIGGVNNNGMDPKLKG